MLMMKRTMMATCLLLTTLLSLRAGNPVKLGVRGGFELTEMNFNVDDLRQTNRAGFYVGPVISFGMPLSGLSMDIGALYSKRDLKVDDEKVKQKSILVPVNMRFGVDVADVMTVFASAGPQLSFNIGDDVFNWVDNEDKTNHQYTMQNTLVSFNFGLGIRLEKHIEAGVYYNLPIGKAADFTWEKLKNELKQTTWSTAKTKTNAWHVSVSYYF